MMTPTKLMFGMFAILQLTSSMYTSGGRYARGKMDLQKQFGEALQKQMYGKNFAAKQRVLQSMTVCRNPDPWGAKCDMLETSTIADVKKTISENQYSTFYCRQCQAKARSMTENDLAYIKLCN